MWKTILKTAVSAIILYLVFRVLDRKLLLVVLEQSNWWWLFWALIWFVLSKVLAACRYNDLLKTTSVYLNTRQQLQLYWLGMYYNLLLPGGISGDGYKIKRLMDASGRPFRQLFRITLYDRISGMLALGQICLTLAMALPAFQTYWGWLLFGLAVSVPASKWLFDQMTGATAQDWGRTTLQSIGVQMGQLISVTGIVFALHEPAKWLGYSVVFLVSSVVAMLPLTIGGAGARELTFLYGAKFLGLNPERSVAIAFVFYLISTAVSLVGIRYSFGGARLQPTAQASDAAA